MIGFACVAGFPRFSHFLFSSEEKFESFPVFTFRETLRARKIRFLRCSLVIIEVVVYLFMHRISSFNSSLPVRDAGGASGSALLGNILTQKINTLSSLSQISGGLSGGSPATGSDSSSNSNAQAGAGVNLGAFANLGGVGS